MRSLNLLARQLSKSSKEIENIQKTVNENESKGAHAFASGRARVLIGTFLAIILIGIAYFYLYTERVGDRIDERRFRMLSDIENHIQQKKSAYLQAVEHINLETALDSILEKDATKSVVNSNDLLQANIKNQIASNLILIRDSIGDDYQDYYYLKDIGPQSDTTPFKLYLKLTSIMSELVPDGIFDHIIILENDADQSLRSLYQSLTNRVIFEGATLDSFLTSSAGFQTGGIEEMMIKGKKYRMYVHVSGTEQLSFSKRMIFCGLIQNSSYQALKRQVNIWLVVILSVLAIVAIICIPLLKIFLINDFEQIQTSDVVLSGLSIILGAPLVLLIFFSVFEYANYFVAEQPEQLENFGNELEKTVYYEVASGLNQLSHLIENQAELERTGGNNFRKLYPEQAAKFSRFSSFNEYYGLDQNGNLTFAYYSKGGDIDTTLNLSERKYFQNLKTEEFLRYDPGTYGEYLSVDSIPMKIPDQVLINGFVMEAVTSWTTGEKELVLGVKSGRDVGPSGTEYLAISIPANRLNKAIIRPGFGFAVFDADGNTWFNANSQSGGTENFLKEIESQDVRSAVFARQEIVTRTEYWEKRIRLHIKPSLQWPVFFGTYYELSNSRSFIAEISSMGLFFVIVATFLVGIMVLISNILKNRDRLVGFRDFAFDWIRPRLAEANNRVYYLSILYMGLIGILFFIFARVCVQDPESLWEKSATLVSMGLVMPSLLYFSNFWIHQIHESRGDPKSSGLIGFLFNPLCRRIFILLAQMILFAFYCWFLCHFISDASIFLSFVGIGFLLLIFFLPFNGNTITSGISTIVAKIDEAFSNPFPKIKDIRKESLSRRQSFNKWYIRYIMFWLVISSLLPLSLVFSLSKNAEEILYSKYEALRIASKIDELLSKDESLSQYESSAKLRKEYSIEKNTLSYLNNLNFHLGEFSGQNKSSARDSLSQGRADKWNNLLFHIRPVFPEMLEDLRVAIRDENTNQRWFSEIKEEGNLSISYRRMISPGSAINISTRLENINKKPIAHGLSLGGDEAMTRHVFFFSLIIFIFLLTRITKYTSSTIFGLQLKRLGSIDIKWKDFKKNFSLPEDRLVICNSERSKHFLRAKIEGCYIIDIQDLYVRLSLKEDQNEQMLLIKEELEVDPKLVLSDRYPSYFFTEMERDENIHQSTIKALHQVLDPLKQIIFNERLHGVETENTNNGDTQKAEKMIQYYEEKKKEYGYFNQLWDSASNRERYVLYDLAKDFIANTKNYDTVSNLCHRGYLHWDSTEDRLEIFNHGFRTYINTAVRTKEGAKMEREKRDRGTWSYLKFIIIGIILAVIAFVSMGNPDFFKDFNALLALVASAVTLYPLIGNLFTVRNRDVG